VFNLEQVGPTARDVALPFGKKGEQPYGVSSKRRAAHPPDHP